MGKYENLAKQIVKNVGGKNNIMSLTHCVTRLRFQLKDETKANDEAIRRLDGVVTLMKSAGQYQVVIGNQVPDVYKDVCEVAGISGTSINKNSTKEKRTFGAIVLDYMSGIFNPVLGVLCASGMLQGILTILTMTGLLQSTDTLYLLLNAAGKALFYFFPVILGYSTAAKFAMNPMLGGVLGAALVYPDIQNLESASLFGINVSGVSYASTVIPIILLIIIAAPVERWLDKVIPTVIKTFVVPMLILMIFVPLGYGIIGPVANTLSNGLTVLISNIYNISPILCGLILGASWQVLVVFGIHNALMMLMLVDLMSGNPSYFLPLMGGTIYAQIAVVFVIWLKTKDRKLKSVTLPAFISGVFGVTEPAIYGVTLPRIKYFIISCIGAAAGGLYAGITNIALYKMTGLGIFALAGYLSDSGTGDLINAIISILITIAVAGIATFILYSDEEYGDREEEYGNREEGKLIIKSPIKGQAVPLSEVEDSAFSQNLLGKGMAIIPSVGKVVAPCNGVLTTMFPTYHALGITSDEGVEILIHIGMDTVQLEGKHFNALAKQGDIIRKGQVLVEFDINAIEKEGYSVLSPIIITNTDQYNDVVGVDRSEVSNDDILLYCERRLV
ncbi:beta-glucoside-specific PTS transporter subunit IIABC [Clostridium sp.]|uniref:beta-glucoside-specific PTS transporter subunit IIABC n=1 Tax=Clostridium sp. TaxID=1506 RepID=UPI001D5D757C|nr:beta-glucoside-specific PTS transporter subunit IIABC [Clostridium sp.]MBS5938650.1 beta-glucoside-specific PTS transporter subunit IIABC [Clostridium sp.]